MVFLGRPAIWGLHHGGQAGVEKVLEIVHTELVNTMELMGAPSPTHIHSEMVDKY